MISFIAVVNFVSLLLLEFYRFATEILIKSQTFSRSIAVCGETTALRAVLAAGAPVSTPDIHGGYPLHYAAQMCGGVCIFLTKIQFVYLVNQRN